VEEEKDHHRGEGLRNDSRSQTVKRKRPKRREDDPQENTGVLRAMGAVSNMSLEQ
jgi:hypothetical protein